MSEGDQQKQSEGKRGDEGTEVMEMKGDVEDEERR